MVWRCAIGGFGHRAETPFDEVRGSICAIAVIMAAIAGTSLAI